jgi:DNA-binding MarR family transcriptional regulator
MINADRNTHRKEDLMAATISNLADSNLARAVRIDTGGARRQQLLLVIAGELDAGRSPTWRELSARLGIAPGELRYLLDRLEADGLLRREYDATGRARYSIPEGGR